MTDPGPPQNPYAPPVPGSTPPPVQNPWSAAPQQPQQPWATSPWGQPPAWYPPATKATSRLAIASLVTAILVLLPVALGLGIAALVRMRRHGQEGWGLLVGALAVCTGWTVLLAAFFTIGVLGGFDDTTRGALADVASYEVGTCLDEDPSAVVDCSAPHDLEVYFSAALPDPVWPGDGDVASAADALCGEAFDGYVGTSYDDSDYDYDYYAPTEQEWASGPHQVVCVITPSGESLTGTVKDSES